MSAKFAFISTLAAVLLVNGLTAGAVTQSIAKDTKKHDKKPAATATAESQRAEEHKKKDDKKQELAAASQRSEEKKKDDEKKQELVAANGYQPALTKPASWRHFQQQQNHRHYRLANV
jgi:hypothetical protein